MTVDDFEEAETRLLACNPCDDTQSEDNEGKMSNIKITRQPSLKDMIDASKHSRRKSADNSPSSKSSCTKSSFSTPKVEETKVTIDSFFQKKRPRNG